ncbi:MAG TPA: hypothetical protein VFS37_06775 [Conexibacter sp.]|nr:hypothetical protein [Conexibacter sp.]
MKLYVCWGAFRSPWGHPCHHALDALRAAGHAPDVVRCYGAAGLPAWANRTRGRREVRRLSGELLVPLLVTGSGELVAGSEQIADWARAHPAARTC